jgi:hypothetical protein
MHPVLSHGRLLARRLSLAHGRVRARHPVLSGRLLWPLVSSWASASPAPRVTLGGCYPRIFDGVTMRRRGSAFGALNSHIEDEKVPHRFQHMLAAIVSQGRVGDPHRGGRDGARTVADGCVDTPAMLG